MKTVAASLVVALAAGPAAAIVGGTPTIDFRSVGEGVQFTANWVVTARHVAINPGGVYVNGWGSAVVAARYSLPDPPGFPQNDLSLVRLATPIAAAPMLAFEGTLLAPGMLSTPIDATIATDSTQVPRGYARTQLREVLDSVEDDNGNVVPVHWLVTYSADRGAPYVQDGDSGGGLFLGHVSDATSPLLGVTSALLNDDDNPAQFASAFVQLAYYRSWIDATMAADGTDTQTALWVNAIPVPEPATAWLALAGGALLFGLRRATAGCRRAATQAAAAL